MPRGRRKKPQEQSTNEQEKKDNTTNIQDVQGTEEILTQEMPKQERFIKIVIGMVVALVLGLIAAALARFYLEASFKVSALLGIIALLVTLWTNKALPLGVVSLLPIILFPSFGILDTKSATQNYANPIIYLFLGGFML